MKSAISLIILCLCFMSILGAQDHTFSPEHVGIIPAEKGSRLLRQCSRAAPDKVRSFFEPNAEDIKLLEANFQKVLSAEATECCGFGPIRGLENFGYQYLGVVIKKRRYIYINAFHASVLERLESDYEAYLRHPIVVCDGGESFWGVLFDLESQEFLELAINGV